MEKSRYGLASEPAVSAACPLCGNAASEEVASSDRMAGEIAIRREFFCRRLRGPVGVDELRDVVEMTDDGVASIARCSRCDVLVRRESGDPVRLFATDHYSDATLRELHSVHEEFFRAKSWVRALLPENAGVLELGCYVGGFLTTAREWGWSITGIDVGRDTARFCRSLGFDVRLQPLEECGFEPHSLDAVFIWNCFEQLPDPIGTLSNVRALLKPRGIAVIRTPDADLYRSRSNIPLLAYNNLLGFPHHFGFNSASLTAAADRAGFSPAEIRRAHALRPLRDRMLPWAIREEQELFQDPEAAGWLEMIARNAIIASCLFSYGTNK